MVRAARDGDRSHATNSESITALENPLRRQKRGSKIAANLRETIERLTMFWADPSAAKYNACHSRQQIGQT